MHQKFLDKSAPPRKGEELSLARLEPFLRENLDLKGEITIEQFPSGHSNLTYLVKADNEELVLRRPPFGAEKIAKGHDMKREYTILSKISQVYPAAPQPKLYTEDKSIIGAPFYVMERIKGIILRRDLPQGLEMNPTSARKLCKEFIAQLARLHKLDLEKAGLSGFGKPEGYCRRQVEGWTKRYLNAKTDELKEMEQVASWLHERIPVESGKALIHNDFKLDNVVLDPEDLTRIIGVLDWEMATVGDPLMDLGGSLGYWVNRDDPEEHEVFRMVPTRLPGMMTREEIATAYAKETGASLSNLVFYYVFGLFKLAVIAQQIYFRYVHGFTRDERFKGFINYVRVLGKAGLKTIERGRI